MIGNVLYFYDYPTIFYLLTHYQVEKQIDVDFIHPHANGFQHVNVVGTHLVVREVVIELHELANTAMRHDVIQIGFPCDILKQHGDTLEQNYMDLTPIPRFRQQPEVKPKHVLIAEETA
jgi:hypothetical protein